MNSLETEDRRAASGPDWRIVLLVGLLGVLLYAPSLNDGFHFDDDLILADSNITNPDRWTHFFNPLRLRQVTYFTFYLNHRIGGDDALGYHAVNVALHSANALLLYLLVTRLAGAWVGAAAALVFVVHPLGTEAVAYVYQRSTLLATFFSLAGLLVLTRGPLAGPWPRQRPSEGAFPITARKGVLAGLLFALAAASKESALAVPLLLAIYAGVRTRRSIAIVLAVGAAGAFALGVLAGLGERTVGIGMLDDLSPLAYFRTELRVLLTYLRLLVVPWPQALEYEFATVESWFDPGAVLGLATAAGLLAIAVSVTRRPRWYWSGMGLAAFLVLLAPTSTIIPSRDFAFEHRLYLPLVGAALAAGHMFSFARRRNLVVIVVVVVFALLSVNRLRAWSDNVTLWEDTVRRAPGKARAWFNLGGAYLAAGDPRAGETFLRVLELDPESIEARYNLGILAQAERRPFEALGWYAEVTALDPTYWPAVNNGGNVYFSLMEYSRAIAAFERVLELNPDHWPAQYNLALNYNALDRPDLAEPRLRTVLDWRPEFAEARYLLGLSLQRLGRVDEARQEFEAVFEATFQAMDGGNSVGGPADLNEADLIELDALEPLQ